MQIHRKRIVIAIVLAALVLVAGGNDQSGTAAVRTEWSQEVTRICTHALLFEGTHESGTRAGAIAVARDIRASTQRRVGLIRALDVSPPQRLLASRWLRLEGRLAATYASSYVRIYEAIAAAKSQAQLDRLPLVLRRLLDAPDGLRRRTASIELRLHVPDCTGGTQDP